jgi:nucleoside-diphosphate-sugar epimerase
MLLKTKASVFAGKNNLDISIVLWFMVYGPGKNFKMKKFSFQKQKMQVHKMNLAIKSQVC